VLFDRTEHEPEEYDPEEEFRDPDTDSLTIPSVSTETDTEPDVSTPELSTEFDEADVPGELLEQFWALVLVLNGAILAAALALLFLIFEGSTTRTLISLGAAVVLSVFAYRRYQAYKTLDIHDDSETAPDEADDETDANDEAGDTNDANDEAGDTVSADETDRNATDRSNAEPADESDPNAADDDAPENTTPDTETDPETGASTNTDGSQPD